MNVRPLLSIVVALAFAPQSMAADRSASAQYGIAFASFAPLNTDIFIADADGSNARPFLADPELDYNASFSHDGNWIVFTSYRNSSADIYRAHPDGSGLERLVDSPAFDDQGSLSPDGKWLAFVSSRSGQADIWILNLASRKVRNLTHHPAGDFRPAWSPDGKWLAFSSDRNSTHPKGLSGFATMLSIDLYIVKFDGTGLRRVTRDQEYAGGPAWSPDGAQLAFYQTNITENYKITSPRHLRGTTQIASINLKTRVRHTLTSGDGEKWSPRWLAPDRIGYVSGGPQGGIEFTAGAAGARGEFGSPDWSPDGHRMVFHRDRDDEWPPVHAWHSMDPKFALVRTGVFPSYAPSGRRLVCNDQTAAVLHSNLLIMDADGSRRSLLFSSADKSSLSPSWETQGNRIAFSYGHFFQTVLGLAAADVAVIRDDGTDLRILTDGKSNYAFPSWSRDGRQIVYREASKQRNGLYIVDAETGVSRALITGKAHYNFPAWSPTDDVIAFISDHEGDYEIYTIKPDGTHIRRLTRSPGNDAHARWSPDGRWLAFASQRGGFKDESVLHPYNPQPYGEIYVMLADGTQAHALTDNQFEDATPTWIPAYVSGTSP